MSEESIKVCSKCGAEYAPEAMVCADCGGNLVFPRAYDAGADPGDAAEAGVAIRHGPLDYLEELGRLLQENRIRSEIRFYGTDPGRPQARATYVLYVSATDEAAAKEIDRAHWLRGAPEHASSFKYEEQELRGVCPACATALPEGSAECPECGLVVNPEVEVAVCPACGAEVGDEVDRCPSCGVEFE